MYFFRLPFENMTYEMKENTFVFTIWRKKIPITDIFVKCIFILAVYISENIKEAQY